MDISSPNCELLLCGDMHQYVTDARVVCLSVRSLNSKTTWPNFIEIFCACCLWPFLGLFLMALRYVMYFRFCENNDWLSAS